MDKVTLLLLVSLILCWTLNPFLKKQALANLSPDESLILNQCLIIIEHFLTQKKQKDMKI